MVAASVETILIQLALLFVVAKIGGFLVSAFRITPLVGEILAGVAVANTPLFSMLALPADLGGSAISVFAELGVVFLIFTVGLETNLASLTRVGKTSITTAILGVIFPFGAGWGLLRWMGYPSGESLFVGVALVATSVGITARVLADLDALATLPARVILGAAVLDDILGLLLLTIVSSAVVTGTISLTQVGFIVATTGAFFLVSFLLGRGLLTITQPRSPTRKTHRWATFMDASDFPVVLALGLCLALSALAIEFGLAAIIGAFVAGLLFEPAKGNLDLEHQLNAVNELLSPFFFVFIGLSVDLATLGGSLGLVVIVTLAAIASKMIGCAIGSPGQGRDTALAVGIGMSPRGEVGIIVALLGLNLGIVDQELYGVVVAMSVITTLIAPPLLAWAIERIPGELPEGPRASSVSPPTTTGPQRPP